MTGQGINTVNINGEIKHITDLDPATLSLEWTKLKNENNELYRCIKEANSGWRGLILRLIGVRLGEHKNVWGIYVAKQLKKPL
ncbi:hypothetical protein [Photorhabdus khanii]|uniref:Uncharacterized protein n=1 Tax=Photorhabdus khanii subsp. guanajuatensis TaxID=2100166 RepID=A0A4R4IL96_9GAMM|nr:hypothetical protein [Photorhabdus khanii]TDB41267.1 hypothetical protein C5467_24515 [Photorhabdus khanii subsp. guanajuatensis]